VPPEQDPAMPHPLIASYPTGRDISDGFASRRPDLVDHRASGRDTIDTCHPKRLHLHVTDVVDETATTKTFRLAHPDGSDLPPFLAGQYVALRYANTTRPYTISSSPSQLGHYDLTVRRVPGGRISNLLIDTLTVGDECVTTGPLGTFHHNPLFHGDDGLFLADGSGVVPAMSMIREIADAGLDRRLHLIYGSRSADDVIFHDELDELAAAHPNIVVDHVIGGVLTAEVVTLLAGDLRDRTVYVCGPQEMYSHVLEQLTSLGHPRRRIRFEANRAPARPGARPPWPSGVDPSGSVAVTVRGTTFRTPRNRPLLEALENKGFRPESACRSGECSLCRVRVRSGVVHRAEEARPRLSDECVGYVHSCVSYPITDIELEL